MKKKISEWIDQHYWYLPEKAKLKYKNTGIGQAGGCMFPHADEAQLTAICRFYIWAFVIDDTYEYGPTEDLDLIRKRALAILNGSEEYIYEAPYLQLPQLRTELLAFTDEAWLARFCNSLDIYFDGILAEVPYRVKMVFPSFPDFYRVREKAVNVFPLVDLAEGITGSVLPDVIIDHPVIRRLSQLTCRILSWSNDYFSAHHEKNKDVWNLVLMLENDHHYTLDIAYQNALLIHDADLAEFCALREELPDFGEAQRSVNAFVENLALMIHGYLYWTNEFTQRYKKGGHPSQDLKAVS